MITSSEDGVLIDLHVQPGAGRSAIVGRYGDALKLKVGAPPVDGRANEAVCVLMAETFGVKRAAVSLVSGPSSRSKRVKVDGVEESAARRIVDRLLGGRPTY
jgi:uncharacterized protein